MKPRRVDLDLAGWLDHDGDEPGRAEPSVDPVYPSDRTGAAPASDDELLRAQSEAVIRLLADLTADRPAPVAAGRRLIILAHALGIPPFDDMNQKDLAAHLGCSEAAVSQRLKCYRVKPRANIGDDE